MTVINTGLQFGESVAADDNGSFGNYFGFQSTHKFFMPDRKQYIEFKALNEGARAAYEAKTSRDVTFSRTSDDAKIKMNSAEDRHELILQSVTGWYMGLPDGSGGINVAKFSAGKGGTFNQWLMIADPEIINGLHTAIRNKNGWMVAEQTAEMIREEIKALEEKLAVVEQREAAAKNS